LKKFLTILALVLAAALLLTGTACAQEEEQTLEDIVESVITVDNGSRNIHKAETVYVIADAEGSADQVIVSEWLKNPENADTLADYTDLRDIKNTNGYETYVLADQALTWDANGNNIHYQGTTDRALPVTVKITYYLDGVAMAPEDMAGQSGHVTIRFDYTNQTQTTVMLDGGKAEISVPFLMASGLILNNNSFSNVTVSNGTVYNDGSRNIVVGCALPGLRDSLALEENENKSYESVVIDADTTDFSLSATVTVAVNGLLDSLSFDSNGLADWNGKLADLQDAAFRLTDGTTELSTAAETLSSGLSTISANSAALTEGADTVFQSLAVAAQEQLNAALAAAGLDTSVSLSPSNYNNVLTELLATVETTAQTQANASAEEQVRNAVIQQVTGQVMQQVTETVNAQVKEQVVEQVTAAMIAKGYTKEKAAAYLQTEEGQTLIASNLKQQTASQEAAQTIEAYTQQQMESDEVQATIETYVTQQMGTDDVQTQIDNAVSTGLAQSDAYQSILALRDQLDDFASFCSGLHSYTDGVDSAYAGSRELASGADTLADNMQAFYTDGVKKLANALHIDCGDTLDRLQAVAEADRAYQSFGGIAQEMNGSVKFIWRTDGI